MSKKTETAPTIMDVQEVYSRFELFVDRNKKAVFIGLGAVVLLVVGLFLYFNFYQTPRENEAANAMWKAQQWFEMDSLEWALNGHDEYLGLEAVAQEYTGTKAEDLAHYYLGIIYRDKAEFETALTHFEEADLDDPVMSVLAQGNIGDLNVELKNLEEGASNLEKAGSIAKGENSGKFLVPVYYLKAAKVYLELGDKDKAKRLLKTIKDDYANFSNTQTEYAEASKLYYMVSAE